MRAEKQQRRAEKKSTRAANKKKVAAAEKIAAEKKEEAIKAAHLAAAAHAAAEAILPPGTMRKRIVKLKRQMRKDARIVRRLKGRKKVHPSAKKATVKALEVDVPHPTAVATTEAPRVLSDAELTKIVQHALSKREKQRAAHRATAKKVRAAKAVLRETMIVEQTFKNKGLPTKTIQKAHADVEAARKQLNRQLRVLIATRASPTTLESVEATLASDEEAMQEEDPLANKDSE